MKIAPITERWNEGECDWSFVENPRVEIESWEKREGLSLPESYRKFMLQYNGGRVYPQTFRTEAGVGLMLGPYVCQSDEAYCEYILSWTSVESHWRGDIFGKGVPPKHLVFAGTPGSIELLMSMTEENYGKIYSWIHTNSDWGEEGNNLIFLLANSFTEFLSSLYDDEEKNGYQNWWTPLYNELAKEFQLDELQ